MVQFLNMVTPEDLFEDAIYQELFDDIKCECEKFGTIETIEIPRPDKVMIRFTIKKLEEIIPIV